VSFQLPISLAVTFALIFSPTISTVRAQQRPLTSDQKKVVDTVSQNWLESAFLERTASTWRIVFMHSTRVPTAIPENHVNEIKPSNDYPPPSTSPRRLPL
jgi:hypothetical protein